MNIQWNAAGYAADFSFVPDYGSSVTALIAPEGCRRVLDLGCGTGTLTRSLSDMGYAVTGMDASEEMLAIARRQHPELTFIHADATAFTAEAPYDCVFSNAVLHWIDPDLQDRMLRCVSASLRPGGQFVFEFGGSGCCARIHEALAAEFAAAGYPYRLHFYFPTVGEYAPRVEAAGMRVAYAALFDRPTPLKGPDGMADWIHMFVRNAFEIVPDPAERVAIIERAVERLRPAMFDGSTWVADYVRIRMRALKNS